jgi:hypothetical protein
MKKNLGSTDKIIRIAAGTIIILLGFYYRNRWGIIGLMPVISSYLGYCPLYKILRITTIRKKILLPVVYPE